MKVIFFHEIRAVINSEATLLFQMHVRLFIFPSITFWEIFFFLATILDKCLILLLNISFSIEHLFYNFLVRLSICNSFAADESNRSYIIEIVLE